ncbi:hypothetical protein GK047_23660 [Paenibacillus sp. SYP-B3998]|uniref:DUF3139 domain-containing protein n=1 Tax=Paenibacillus sp. SYP-B3998 TaxID=2678564 RepID=A0A6G4A4X4_9BACL|nr:hypothetical protein [Paenibacillus sp. SYP-B3998]NEW08994.1 hypothetical protein [Paenibacillus sp. SYP-B3998]
MKLTKIKIVLLSFLLCISIAYAVKYVELFMDAGHVDASPEASVERYLNSKTKEYKIISIALREKEFRSRIYRVECECIFKNEENRSIQRYDFYLIDDLGWIVEKYEKVES